MGGRNTAAQPVETLLAAWMGCTQATAVFVGRHMKERVRVEKLAFDVEAWRDERGALQLPLSEHKQVPSRLLEISGTIQVYAQRRLSNEEMVVFRDETEERCPIANMIMASGCKMNVEWVNGESKLVDE
jgi:putative redox protein